MASEEMTAEIVVEKAMKGILEVLQQKDEEIASLKGEIQSRNAASAAAVKVTATGDYAAREFLFFGAECSRSAKKVASFRREMETRMSELEGITPLSKKLLYEVESDLVTVASKMADLWILLEFGEQALEHMVPNNDVSPPLEGETRGVKQEMATP